METNKKAQYQSFDRVVSPYQQWKGAEFGQLKYMDLSFLCNWKPLCASGEGELLPPASYSEDAGCQLPLRGQNFCTVSYEK